MWILFVCFYLISGITLSSSSLIGLDYLAAFLRLAKNNAAAMIMIAQPPIVKIVVPIPPVDGNDESVLSIIFPVALNTSVAVPLTVNSTTVGVSLM